jgi:2'-hydroxyisoflavone reductase
MRLLVVGGTVFLGRHLVSAALAAGHEVTTVNRGTHNLDEQAGVERLIADRNVDLSALAGRTFDAVIDTCGYHPETVAYSVQTLGANVGTYVFISTISVYGDFSTIGIDEEHPIKYTAPGEQGDYGSLKADCERVVSELLPESSLIIRPGLIVGPYDPTDRFTYWPARFARDDSKILVPERMDYPVQFIDARDLALFMLKLTEAQARGVYIVTGPQERTTLEHFLEACDVAVGKNSELGRVQEAVLEIEGVAPWTELPLWIPASKKNFAGMMRVDFRKALEAGLKCRSLVTTIRDTLSWDQTRDPSMPRQAGLSPEREAALLRQPKRKLNIGRGPLPGAGLR